MVVLPVLTPVAKPLLPKAFEMVAAVVADEAQVTDVVRLYVVLSVKIPVAANCCVVPLAMVFAAGVTVMETSAAVVTVNVAVLLIPPKVALIIVVPWPTEVARPRLPAAFETVAAAVFTEPQVTLPLRSCVVVSLYVPVATNC
jgi:hypothetical protein